MTVRLTDNAINSTHCTCTIGSICSLEKIPANHS